MPTINAINSNIPIEVSKGGTNATTFATTDGVVYFDGTRLVTTAVGTATQVLTSNGAGVAPTFQAAGGGGGGAINLILTQTAAAVTAVNFTTGISGTFNNYILMYDKATNPNLGGDTLILCQVSTDGGATYINSGYLIGVGAANGLFIGEWGDNTAFSSGNITLMNLTSGSGYISSSGSAIDFIVSGPNASNTNPSGAYGTANITANALRIVSDDGTAFSGVFSLYSVSK